MCFPYTFQNFEIFKLVTLGMDLFQNCLVGGGMSGKWKYYTMLFMAVQCDMIIK